MVLKLRATHEMNFWECEIQGALDLSDLTVLRFGTTQINTQTNVSVKLCLI